MVTRAHVMPYVGQRVVVHTTDGAIHHGILHSVGPDGIYMRSLRGRVGMVSERKGSTKGIDLLHNLPEDAQIEEAFWPFFFIPFLALAAVAAVAAVAAWGPWGYWW